MNEDICLTAVIFIAVISLLIGIQFLPVPQETNEEMIKGTPVEYEADAPVLELQQAWISDDTPEDDADADNFEMLCNCVYAESGNQSDYGVRLCADVILNRADGDISKIDDVISAPYQFSSYSDGGMKKWCDVPDRIIQLCAEEMQSRANTQVWYFRTGHYSEYGTPWQRIGDHYFSTK